MNTQQKVLNNLSVIASIDLVSVDYDNHYYNELVEALKGCGCQVTFEDVRDWYEDNDEGDPDKVDEAAKQVLGDNTYRYYHLRRSVPAALDFKLGIEDEPVVDGVDVSLILDDEEETARIKHRRLQSKSKTRRKRPRTAAEKARARRKLRKTKTRRRRAAKRYYRANKAEMHRTAKRRALRKKRGDNRVTRVRSKTDMQLRKRR